ncbi:serine/threonine-protein kinase [Micromonospora sp. CPCC 206060]|uniref:serine/threonine-protein kinase n=1 Tax=Micromonospora sp. CPCC 206060 TaxID=3122406 RepID=UPI002FF09749
MRTLGGRYRLEQRIGLGGMSEVWRGHDRVLDRPVAIKIMAPERDGTGHRRVDRVRTEARSAARLVHPNVAGVHDFGTSTLPPDQQVPYIVMELVEGETLGAHLAAGPLDWRIALRVGAEVSAALAAAHTHGIVHRDIKPGNIILTPAGAKVLDFGIATPAGRRDADDGTVLGTPAYTAPESFDGTAATPAADMYALGVLLYLCLTGRLPWPPATAPGLLRSPRQVEPDPLPPVEGLPAGVTDLIHRCLAEEPTRRPSSLVAALLLAEAVDARVYVPMRDMPVPRPRTGRISPWTEEAANAATEAAPLGADLR